MIRIDLPNVVTIALAGALGYGVLVGLVKLKQIVSGASSAGQ